MPLCCPRSPGPRALPRTSRRSMTPRRFTAPCAGCWRSIGSEHSTRRSLAAPARRSSQPPWSRGSAWRDKADLAEALVTLLRADGLPERLRKDGPDDATLEHWIGAVPNRHLAHWLKEVAGPMVHAGAPCARSRGGVPQPQAGGDRGGGGGAAEGCGLRPPSSPASAPSADEASTAANSLPDADLGEPVSSPGPERGLRRSCPSVASSSFPRMEVPLLRRARAQPRRGRCRHARRQGDLPHRAAQSRDHDPSARGSLRRRRGRR